MPRLHTLCVTLEPCNHFGRTPPCAEGIIDAGVRRVVVGCRDPNPEVKGGGCDRLRQAGIEVIEGVEQEACRRLIHSFAYFAQKGTPLITVKRAFDTNESMIPPPGQKTFTSPKSLILAHRLRKKADAIITGSGTVLADNPLFTVRQIPDFLDKRRVLAILDRRGRVPKGYIEEAKQRGLDAVVYKDLDSCLFDLKKRQMKDVLVESGPILSQSILDSCPWAMLIDIHHEEKDQVKVTLNPRVNIPFDGKNLDLNSLLPL